jgi:electron transfer flavoprotein alpha subunit
MSENVLVVLEHDAHGARAAGLGLLAPAARIARELGATASGVVVGALAPDARLLESPLGRLYAAESGVAEALAHVIDLTVAAARAAEAPIILIAETTRGRELAGGVAAALRAGLGTAAHALRVCDGRLEVTAAKLGGSVVTICAARPGYPFVVLVRPNTFRENEAASATPVTKLLVPVRARDASIEERRESEERTVMLEEADVVVSGGRGLGGPEPFRTWLAELAAVCGGAVGASRAVVDAGWAPHAQQVGQTGKTVRPRLYFAVAISGAIQHRVGMRMAGSIVAINKEAEIPLAEIADLLVVGDAFAVVPELTRLIRQQKGIA